MKRFAVIFMSIILALGIFGCGNETKKAEEQQTAVSSSKESSTVKEDTAETSSVEEETKEVSEKTDDETVDVSETEVSECPLEDGIYTAEFITDSSMFHVNEACEGKGTLTVKDGKMTIHVSLVSKNIVNLFLGTADEAQADGAVLLEATTDEVTYSDGITEEVYGFDIPVAALDEEFDCALIGKKQKWYDHKVSVTNVEPMAE